MRIFFHTARILWGGCLETQNFAGRKHFIIITDIAWIFLAICCGGTSCGWWHHSLRTLTEPTRPHILTARIVFQVQRLRCDDNFFEHRCRNTKKCNHGRYSLYWLQPSPPTCEGHQDGRHVSSLLAAGCGIRQCNSTQVWSGTQLCSCGPWFEGAYRRASSDFCDAKTLTPAAASKLLVRECGIRSSNVRISKINTIND